MGNIYANEALYLSGIKPTADLGPNLQERVSSAWLQAIQAVLTKAIQAGGTSLRDFLKEDGTPGYFRHELKVYGREGECLRGLRRRPEIAAHHRAGHGLLPESVSVNRCGLLRWPPPRRDGQNC